MKDTKTESLPVEEVAAISERWQGRRCDQQSGSVRKLEVACGKQGRETAENAGRQEYLQSRIEVDEGS